MKSYPGVDKVRRFLLNHQWVEAERFLEEVMAVSENAGALNDLALIYARTGEWEQARRLMESAMQQPDRDVRTRINYFYIAELMALDQSRGEKARERVLDLKVGDQALKPRLSIVMRTLNRGEMIRGALKSVLDQNFKNWELVIVNDGGERAVEQILESLWDRRMVYAYARHSGPAGAFNVGLRLARGEMIGFLDDDDLAYPESWDRLQNHLETHPDSRAVYSDLNLAWMDLKTGAAKRTRPHPNGEFQREKLWSGFFIMNLMTLVIRRECLERMPGFLEGLSSSVDWEFLLALSHHTNFDYLKNTAGELRYWEGLDQVGKRSVLDRNHQRNLISYLHGITPFYQFGFGGKELHSKFLETLERLLTKFPDLIRGLELRKLLNEPAYSMFYQLGVELLKEGKKREARECFSCAGKLAPGETRIWWKLVRSWF